MSCKVNYAERMGEDDQAISARRPRMTADVREAMIVAEAIRVVAEDGFDISVRDLALRIGVKHSVLFRHFPSKEALAKRIYDEVFVARLDSRWQVLLEDEAVPLAERLLTFYRAYTAAIFDPTWVRIFLFAGLKGTSLNADYFSILQAQLLAPICAAVRRHVGRERQGGAAVSADMERAWSLHGRIFYMAVRLYVYRRPLAASLEAVLSDAIDAFLDEAGRPDTASAPDEPPPAREPGRIASPTRRMSHDVRRRAIVDGAIPFFARHGIRGQMRGLASHLGTTHSLLFYYFPQKQDLIDEVYLEVFQRPWLALKPLLADRHPLREKLIAFYCAYLAIIDREEWIRIFISAGLHDAELCERYLDLVEKEIIDVTAEAARKLINAPPSYGLHEDAWGLHGQIVYTVICTHIYGMPTYTSRNTTVEIAVAAFFSSLEIKHGRLEIDLEIHDGNSADRCQPNDTPT